MNKSERRGEFVFETPDAEAIESALYQEHLKLADRSHIAAFAGYLMPLWYSSISREHQAVRQSAGLFDCTHMGVLEVAGKDAAAFLNFITTNEISDMTVGAARYSYVLDAAGNVLDDIIIYRRGEDKFMVVVNAANELKIKAYLESLQEDKICIDADDAGRRLLYKPSVRDMRDTFGGSDCRVDIALQGPTSTDVLLKLADKKTGELVRNLKSFHFIETTIAGIDCIISRTGYTGAKIGFELFVHPKSAPQLWNLILENGKSFGLMPCGLGARDSLRVEAGLPLYGHELAGTFNISPFEAGYGWAVKLEKEFFIGMAAMKKKAKTYNMQVARIELPGEKGIRPVRQGDGVLDDGGRCIGWVLSCAGAGEKQIALVYMNKDAIKEGGSAGVYYLARSQGQAAQGRKQTVQKGENLKVDIAGTQVSRFARF